MMRATLAVALAVLAGVAQTAAAAPPTKPVAAPTAPAPPSATRSPVAGELAELARTALSSSVVRLPKGATVLAAHPSSAGKLLVPVAPSHVTIDVTPPARRAGPVTATAVLVFWKDTEIAARVPLRLDLSIPPEALIYDVPKGRFVTLVVRRGLVEVTAPAVASSDGDVGDVIQVLLRPSGRALRAEIIANDRAVAVEDGR
jgi:hypothetical protein